METTPAPKPTRKAKAAEHVEPGQKPKKVNSEIRKQQNRIASRNYREKRKKKLQYLQQLLRDGPSEQQQPDSASPESNDEDRGRSLSTEYLAPSPSCTSISLPDNNEYGRMSSHGVIDIDPSLAHTGVSYDGHFLQTPQIYDDIHPSWSEPTTYDTQYHMSTPAWNLPQWLPNSDCAPPIESMMQQNFQCSIPQSMHAFDSCSTPPLPPQGTIPNADICIKDSYTYLERYPDQSHHHPNCNQDNYTSTHPVYI